MVLKWPSLTRLIRCSLWLAVVPVVAPAVTVHYIDPFGTAATSCSSPSCDVIGDSLWFDLDRVSMTIDPVTLSGVMSLTLNFGPNATLAPFLDFGIRLDPADVIFTVNGAPGYGIPLTNHSGVDAGTFYLINSASGVLTAGQVLNLGSGYAYRPDAPVWLTSASGSLTALSAGDVSSAITGDGITTGRMTVTIHFTATTEFLADLSRGVVGMQFASATCGNDIMTAAFGAETGNPEPATFGLVLIGLAVGAGYKRQVAAPIVRRVFRS